MLIYQRVAIANYWDTLITKVLYRAPMAPPWARCSTSRRSPTATASHDAWSRASLATTESTTIPCVKSVDRLYIYIYIYYKMFVYTYILNRIFHITNVWYRCVYIYIIHDMYMIYKYHKYIYIYIIYIIYNKHTNNISYNTYICMYIYIMYIKKK